MPARPPSTPALVLIVEDELLLRLHARDVIEEAGFSVRDVDNADSAIEILETCPEIRLVVTDIQIPGSMDGLKLAHAIRNRWPPVELILTSGLPAPAANEIPIRGLFFSKPYDTRHFQTAITSFLH